MRIVFRVRFDKKRKRWNIVHPNDGVVAWRRTKFLTVQLGAQRARDVYKSSGTFSQLVVHNKNGRIAFERTYGGDPRRSKG